MSYNFTEASAAAIQEAMNLAEEKHHTEVHESHLLYSFLSQEDGYFPMMFKQLKLPIDSLINATLHFINELPIFSGQPQKPTPSRSFQNRIQEAAALAKEWKDSYISSDHFFSIFWKNGGEPLASWKKQYRITPQDVDKEIQKIRGDRTMDSPTSESSLQALRKVLS